MAGNEPRDGKPPASARSAQTDGLPDGILAPGQMLGDRYQIRSQLGRGGMGEVWRAVDLKLRVDVALKALLPKMLEDRKRRETLRREVRAARNVISPNVCRIFDLIEADGIELVSMEYIDGDTLLHLLAERAPLDLKEAQDIASQFLAGLEAIHQTGLVHRDVKPENIMITRAGRVVLMDFGLARPLADGGGTVAGTPAYMAPEQAAGLEVDARADVYSAGVVLAEMVSPGGIRDFESRQSVWEGIRQDPARLPDSPWAPVLRKAVAKDLEQRYDSAHALTRALEEVTLRVDGAEDLKPYPGLASFTEENAEYFFGREAEAEVMWGKLQGPPRLLAIMGPSGAGKTSFIRAGMLPAAPAGWAIVRCTPGGSAIASLRSALTPELTGDTATLQALMSDPENTDVIVAAFASWRKAHEGALLIVDQFEELFTLSPRNEQEGCAALLGRLPLEADVHVVVSIRDDFASSCNAFEPLRPVFHELTVLDPPTGASLRRALVQPAASCGYHFEDGELVDEMLAEVEGERGALPLLAFAAASMWELRNRESGHLTRQAFLDIGGVGGALARHAETTMDRIGTQRHAVVRELFRNLVTAEGTRAVREWDELLSVFDDSLGQSAEGVLRELIDARLLTSYEVHEEDREPTRRVEIIHESLLANWPRLVRWQTQDADAVQLRDELRQAARMWDEHDRSDDLLWTGSAYREFAVWRERYPGGLTESEEAFSRSITAHAKWRRRRRRIVAASALVLTLALAVVFGSLWRRSLHETRRAEASKLLALGRLSLDTDPNESDNPAALAFAIASLELADEHQAREFALEVLWRGPSTVHVGGGHWGTVFSWDGKWLANLVNELPLRVLMWPRDGAQPAELGVETDDAGSLGIAAVPNRDQIAVWTLPRPMISVWSLGESGLLRTFDIGNEVAAVLVPDAERLVTLEPGDPRVQAKEWPIDGSAPRILGQLGAAGDSRLGKSAAVGNRLVYADGRVLQVYDLDRLSARARLLSGHEGVIRKVAFDRTGRMLASADSQGEIRLWSLGPRGSTYLRSFQRQDMVNGLVFDVGSTRLASATTDGTIWVHDLRAPPDALPLVLHRKSSFQARNVSFTPDGRWLATDDVVIGGTLWDLSHLRPYVLDGHRGKVWGLEFTPDGEWLVSASGDGTVRLWPMSPEVGASSEVVFDPPGEVFLDLAIDPNGRYILATGLDGRVWFVTLADGEARKLEGFNATLFPVAVSPDGRFAAAAGGHRDPREKVIRIWDLESGDVRILGPSPDPQGTAYMTLSYTPDGSRLVSGGWEGLRIWDIESGNSEYLGEGHAASITADGRFVYEAWSDLETPGGAGVHDLETREFRRIPAHASAAGVVLDPTGTILVSTGLDGTISVGPASGEEPHRLYGHQGMVICGAFSPDGRWLATGGDDGTIRVWQMPDFAQPPLHTLPDDELMAKLKALTNIRAVKDDAAPNGYRIEPEPFAGWADVPEW